MKFDNICSKKTYTKKNGEEKTTWPIVGTLKTTDDNKRFIELNIFPNITFFVFEQKTKEEEHADGDLGF